jgi:hypothetical protein
MADQVAEAARRTVQILKTARAAASSPFLRATRYRKSEATAAQALTDFFFRENAQTCCTPVNVDHGDSRRF